jgi:putative monooxygenase
VEETIVPDQRVVKVAAEDVAVNCRRGGAIRVLLSPATVGSTSGFMGATTLPSGEAVREHRHPYSEEFVFVTSGSVVIRLDGEQELTVGPGEAVMVPKDVRHRMENQGDEQAVVVFHLSPLAPRPDLGHVDTEPLPAAAEAGESG